MADRMEFRVPFGFRLRFNPPVVLPSFRFQLPAQLPWSWILLKLLGVVSGFGGIFAMEIQAFTNHQKLLGVLILLLIPVLGIVWFPVALSSADEIQRLKDRLDGWDKPGWLKAFFFVLSVVGGVAVMHFDTTSSVADPVLFTGISLSWFCLLRLVRPGNDYGVLGFLSSAVSVRAVKLWGLKHLLSYCFFIYSCAIGLLRIYLERRDTAA